MRHYPRLRQILIIVILLAGIIGTIGILPVLGPYIGRNLIPSRWDPPIVDREAIPSSPFTSLWVRSNVFMEADIGDIVPLFVIDNSVFLIAGTTQNEPLSLLHLDMSDSHVIWTYPANNAELVYNSKYLFLGEQGLVTAVDMNSGEQVWRRRLPVSKAVERIVANEEMVSLDVVPTYFYVLDADTGQIRDSTTSTQTRPYFYGDHETLEFHVASSSVWAEDKQTGEITWKQSLGVTITEPPFLNNNQLIVKEGQIGRIYAFDSATGSILWQSIDEAVSNIAVDDSMIYFLTLNAQLVVLSTETGQPLATLDFAPVPLADPYERGYHVACDSGIVAVYFGDSRELFLLRYTGTP